MNKASFIRLRWERKVGIKSFLIHIRFKLLGVLNHLAAGASHCVHIYICFWIPEISFHIDFRNMKFEQHFYQKMDIVFFMDVTAFKSNKLNKYCFIFFLHKALETSVFIKVIVLIRNVSPRELY